jgi:hypothetical protein
VNARFKSFVSDIPPLPKKTEMDSCLLPWIRKVHDSIALTMHPDTIRHAFRVTGFHPYNSASVLAPLPETSPTIVKKRSLPIEISGKFVTEKTFLSSWLSRVAAFHHEQDVEKEEVEKKEEEKKEEEKKEVEKPEVEKEDIEWRDESSSMEECIGGEGEDITDDFELRRIPECVDLRLSLIGKQGTERGFSLSERFDRLTKDREMEEETRKEEEEDVERELGERRKYLRKEKKTNERKQKMREKLLILPPHTPPKKRKITSERDQTEDDHSPYLRLRKEKRKKKVPYRSEDDEEEEGEETSCEEERAMRKRIKRNDEEEEDLISLTYKEYMVRLGGKEEMKIRKDEGAGEEKN